MATYRCSICGIIKDIIHFSKDRSRKKGHRSDCKDCNNAKQKEKRDLKPLDTTYSLVEISVDGKAETAKRCRGCQVIKPLYQYYRNESCLGGVAPRCKTCDGYKGKIYRSKIVKKDVSAKKVEYKTCTKCLELKHIESFTVIKGKRKGVGGRYARCKECEREYRRDLHKDPERTAKRLAKSREYTQKYKIRKRKLSKEHREANPEIYKTKDANRWARKKLLRHDLTTDQYREILNMFSGGCALTGDETDVTLEHFIPLSVGHGGTYLGNVYPISGSLNYSKNGSNPFEWVRRSDIQARIDPIKWEALIKHLAEANGMSLDKYKKFVNWCFDNPRSIEELREDSTFSLDLFHMQEKEAC